MNKLLIFTTATLAGLGALRAEAGPPFPFKMHAELSGAEQVVDTRVAEATLPVVGLVTGAYGEAQVTLSRDRSTLHYRLKVSPTATPIFMAHIHLGPQGRNGPVILWLFGDASSNPLPFTLPRDDGPFSGEISGMLTASNLIPQPSLGLNTFEDVIANLMRGNAYVNVHTQAHPPGEVRGQLEGHEHSNFGFGWR